MTLGFPASQNAGSNITTEAPLPKKEKGQRSISSDDIFFARFVTPWSQPDVIQANTWRNFVAGQPIAMDCKESLQASTIGFDWSITARDSDQRDELKGLVKHYTKLIDRGGEYYGFGYEGLIEWILSDFLDIPFGCGAEIGRKGDNPNGRVAWIKPLDGATLFPTLNKDIPVVQYYNGHYAEFPAHAISRVYMSPRTQILRDGWGMPPPEKVYLAMLMLSRGDKYYADLLMDTPPAGILDLGDMEKDSALDWVKAFREFNNGSPSSFAIPVLYEHTTDVKFLPFGKVPNDIMYDRITLKYAAIVAAAYGVSLSDIGLGTTSASGETLAGSIRQERKTRRTGIARAKKAIKHFMENFLPYTLQFNIIDPDDEVNMAMGRARLATFTSFQQASDMGLFSREELRLQTLQDGLMSKDFPEAIPEGVVPLVSGNSPERPGTLGSSESAATGGQGAVRLSTVSVAKSKNFESHVKRLIGDLVKTVGKSLVDARNSASEDELYLIRSMVDNSLFGEVDDLEIIEALKAVWQGKSWLKLSYDASLAEELERVSKDYVSSYVKNSALLKYENGELDELEVYKLEEANALDKLQDVNWKGVADEFRTALTQGAKEFLSKSTIFLLKDVLLSENGVDTDIETNYDSIVKSVHDTFYGHFDEYVSAYVGIETENLMEKIRREVLKND